MNRALGLMPLAVQSAYLYKIAKAIKSLPPGDEQRKASRAYWAIVAPALGVEAYLIGRGLKRNHDIKKRLKEKEEQERRRIEHGVLSSNIFGRKDTGMSCYNELYHYGVPGMKWGVRRYQNSDGSLTPAGARRYGGNASGTTSSGSSGSSGRKKIDKRKLARNIAIGVGTAAAIGGAAYGIHRLRKSGKLGKIKEAVGDFATRNVSGPGAMRPGRFDDFGNYVPTAYSGKLPKIDQYADKGRKVLAERREKARANSPYAKALNDSFNSREISRYDQPIGPLTRDQFIAKGRAARKAVDVADGKYDNKIGAFDRYVSKGKEVLADRKAKARDNSPYAKALNDSFSSDYNSPIGPTKSGKAKGRNAGRLAELVRRGEDEVRKSVNRGMREPFNEDGSITPGRLERYAAKGQSVLNRQAIASGKRKAQNRAKFNEYVAKGREVMADRAAKKKANNSILSGGSYDKNKIWTNDEWNAYQLARKIRNTNNAKRVAKIAGAAAGFGAAAGAAYGGRKLAGRSKKRRK